MPFRDETVIPEVYVAAADTPAGFASGAQYRCTGVGDQETIEAAALAVPGGVVNLLAGTFEINAPLTIPGVGTVLRGAAEDVTVIQLVATWPAVSHAVSAGAVGQRVERLTLGCNGVDFGVPWAALLSSVANGLYVADVVIANLAGPAGLPFDLRGGQADRLTVRDCATANASTFSGSGSAMRGCAFDNVVAGLSVTSDARLVGCTFADSGQVTLYGGAMESCDVVRSVGDGVRMAGADTAIHASRIEDAAGNGIEVDASSCQVVGVLVLGAGLDAINVTGDDACIVGAQIATPQQRGVYVASTAARALIEGCRIRSVDRAVAGWQEIEVAGDDAFVTGNHHSGAEGVTLAATSSGVVLVGNKLGGSAITNAGAGNTIAPNY